MEIIKRNIKPYFPHVKPNTFSARDFRALITDLSGFHAENQLNSLYAYASKQKSKVYINYMVDALYFLETYNDKICVKTGDYNNYVDYMFEANLDKYKEMIKELYGEKYIPDAKKIYKTKYFGIDFLMTAWNILTCDETIKKVFKSYLKDMY